MKKRFLLLSTLLLIFCLISTASADAIFEPNNSFYSAHQEECTYLNRSFYANGKDGYVDFKSSPNGVITQRFENGTILHVDWQYENWGSVSIRAGKTQTDGWVCLDDLSLVYDYISFQEEYGDQIKPYRGEFAGFDKKITCINFFSYPGAPEVRLTKSLKDNTSSNQDFMNALTSTEKTPISSVFTDESGLTWGCISYWRGYRNIWFCLDNPEGSDFPVRDTNQQELIPPSAPPSILSNYLPYLLVGGLVITTAILLFFMGRRIKTTEKTSLSN